MSNVASSKPSRIFWGRAAEMFDGLLASEPDPDAMLAVRVSLERLDRACMADCRLTPSDSWLRSAAWPPNGAAIGSGSRGSNWTPGRFERGLMPDGPV